MSDRLRVAAIRGDGIGGEVVDAALPVLAAAVEPDGVRLEVTMLDWGGDRFLATGAAMPDDAIDVVRAHDAVLLGAVGHPQLTPAQSVWTLVLPLRQRLQLFANVRPIRVLPGLEVPVPGAVGADFVIVRENTEGEYSGVGGPVHEGTAQELATDVVVHTRAAIERVARYALGLVRDRGESVLTLATKSNVMPGYALWDRVVAELAAAEFPGVAVEPVFVDALGARLITHPRSLGVVLASNMFGDILSDVAAPLAGGLGMAPSANVAPGTGTPGVYEPVHGSAPDIAGQGIANPVAAILSGELLLRDAGLTDAADRIRRAVEAAVADPAVRTPDLGGRAGTAQLSDAVRSRLG